MLTFLLVVAAGFKFFWSLDLVETPGKRWSTKSLQAGWFRII